RQLRRVHDIAERFAHLLAARRDEAMHQYGRWQRNPRREQHSRPVDRMEADDILAEHMCPVGILLPIMLIERAVVAIAQRRDVVAERIVPDVDHLRGVAGNRDAPAVGALARPRDAEILQAAPDEAEYLVLACLRDDSQRIRGDQRLQLLGVAREAEEVVLLLHYLWRDVVNRAEAIYQLILAVEQLAADAVQPTIVALVDVAVARARLPQLVDAGHVARIGAGADEVVERGF